MASGGVRYDFTTEDNFTQGENRTIRIPIEDSAGDPVVSFSGWEFTFYILTALNKNDTPLITVEDADISSTAPNVDVPLVPADTADLKARTYFYELWRTDTNNVIRLAYGQFPIID